MVEVRGKSDVRAFFAKLPAEIERKLLRGAGKAAATVIAEEARQGARSDEVRGKVTTWVTSKNGKVIARVFLKGRWANSLGNWQEYGTEGHFISVDPEFNGGRTARRINRLDTEARAARREGPGRSLFINGKPVGATVWHPGARAQPFLRPALDNKAGAASAAAQAYINSRVSKAGISGAPTDGAAE